MTRARELQAAGLPADTPRETFTRPTKGGASKARRITVTLTVAQAQALVEAGEEWPDFTDMSGTQRNASKRGAKELRSALLGVGRGPTWK